jgi:hypothetical protein
VNNREGNYRFTDDNEPEHMPRDSARSKVGAEPSTKDRDKDEDPVLAMSAVSEGTRPQTKSPGNMRESNGSVAWTRTTESR